MNANKLLVPIRFSPGSKGSLIFAARMAERLHKSLVLLHVVQRDYAEAESDNTRAKPAIELITDAEQKLRGLVTQVGIKVPVEIAVEVGQPVEVILKKAVSLGVEAIILCTHGCSRWLRWLHHNTALKVLRKSTCPIWLLCPGRGGKSASLYFVDPCLASDSVFGAVRSKCGNLFDFAA
jgi:nucleotide-binding universal stress UspA family protein